MQAGDIMSYQVLAWDNHPSHGPSYSSTYFVHVPYAFEAYEEAETETKNMVEELDNIHKNQKETEALISQMKKDKLEPTRKLGSEKTRANQRIGKKTRRNSKKLKN